jgi:DNA-binding CsgD family transcriptional regulator
MRQRQVAALVGLNFTYQQIGEILCISPHTARTHTRNVLRKLRIDNKAELRVVLSILEEQGVINLQGYSNHLDQRWIT